MQIVNYRNTQGQEPFANFLSQLKDQQGKHRILATLKKIELDNESPLERRTSALPLWEIRVMGKGPGYRLYCVRDGEKLIILLGAGIKDTQARDIKKMEALARDIYQHE